MFKIISTVAIGFVALGLAACQPQYRSGEVLPAYTHRPHFDNLDCDTMSARVNRLEEDMLESEAALNKSARNREAAQVGAFIGGGILAALVPSNREIADVYAQKLGAYQAALDEFEEQGCLKDNAIESIESIESIDSE